MIPTFLDYLSGYISLTHDALAASAYFGGAVEHARSQYLGYLPLFRWQNMAQALADAPLMTATESEFLVAFSVTERRHWMVQMHKVDIAAYRYSIIETHAPLSIMLQKEPTFLWDINGDIVWLNVACQKLLGFNQDVMRVSDVDFGAVIKDLQILEEVQGFVKTLQVEFEKDVQIRQGGSYSWYNMKLEVLRRDSVNGEASVVSGNLTNISRWQYQISDLQIGRSKLQQILTRLPIPLYELSNRLELLWCNPAHESICCKSFDQLKGYGWAELFDFNDSNIQERIDQFHEKFRARTPYATIDPYLQKDSSTKWGRGAISFQVEGHEQTFIGYLTEVTDLVNREDTLKQTNIELQKAIESSMSAQKARTLFFASVSHEIRSPLNGILGNAHLLIESGLNQYQQESCQVILDCSNHLLQLVSDILELSKIQSEIDTYGNLTIKNCQFDLVKFATQVLGMFKVKADNKHLQLLLEIYVNGKLLSLQNNSYLILTDEAKVRQVIINLLSNAIKFSEKGTVKFVIEINQNDMRVVISDQGIGIKEEDVIKLFQPFVQANSHLNINYEGFGLGLSICDRLVKALGGSVSLETALGKGSTFTITLPIEIPKQEQILVAQLTKLTSTKEHVKTIKILVCDDNAVNRMVLVRMLMSQDYACSKEAINGQEALDALMAEHYDLAFMDISLPDFSGIEVLKKYVKASPRIQKTWMIACTANCMSGDEESYIEAGFDAFLSKPFGPRQLKQMIHIYLQSLE